MSFHHSTTHLLSNSMYTLIQRHTLRAIQAAFAWNTDDKQHMQYWRPYKLVLRLSIVKHGICAADKGAGLIECVLVLYLSDPTHWGQTALCALIWILLPSGKNPKDETNSSMRHEACSWCSHTLVNMYTMFDLLAIQIVQQQCSFLVHSALVMYLHADVSSTSWNPLHCGAVYLQQFCGTTLIWSSQSCYRLNVPENLRMFYQKENL